jgi:hypothetical protein
MAVREEAEQLAAARERQSTTRQTLRLIKGYGKSPLGAA